jgi:hypothetical protein
MNKLLMEENDRLQKQVSQLVYENGYYRQQTQSVRVLPLIAQLLLPLPLPHLPFQACSSTAVPVVHPSAVALLQAGLATTDTSCESVVTSGPQNVAAVLPQAQPRDAGPAGYVLLSPCLPFFAFILPWQYGWHQPAVSMSVSSLQAHVHSGGDTDGVSVQGHRHRRRVGPDARDEGWSRPLNHYYYFACLFASESLLYSFLARLN